MFAFVSFERKWIFYPKKPKGTAKKLVGERFRDPYEVTKIHPRHPTK
jgi:hypothetical protein